MTTSRLLFVGACPAGLLPLDVDGEFDRIQRVAVPRLDLLSAGFAVTLGDVVRRIVEARPQALHIATHGIGRYLPGTGEPHRFLDIEVPATPLTAGGTAQFQGLAFHGDQGLAAFPPAVLTELLEFIPGVRLVLLNACWSASQAEDIVAQAHCAVIGMTRLIADSTAIAFSGAFYGPLSTGAPAGEAFEVAREAIAGLATSDVPRFFGDRSVRLA